MRNPYHYQNYIKLYILCLLARVHHVCKQAHYDSLTALLLSKFELADIEILSSIKQAIQLRREQKLKEIRNENVEAPHTEGAFEQEVILICRALLKYNCYRKFNNSSLLANFARNRSSYTYEQIQQLFLALCRYVGIKARMVFLLDLRALNVTTESLIKLILKSSTRSIELLSKV